MPLAHTIINITCQTTLNDTDLPVLFAGLSRLIQELAGTNDVPNMAEESSRNNDTSTAVTDDETGEALTDAECIAQLSEEARYHLGKMSLTYVEDVFGLSAAYHYRWGASPGILRELARWGNIHGHVFESEDERSRPIEQRYRLFCEHLGLQSDPESRLLFDELDATPLYCVDGCYAGDGLISNRLRAEKLFKELDIYSAADLYTYTRVQLISARRGIGERTVQEICFWAFNEFGIAVAAD